MMERGQAPARIAVFGLFGGTNIGNEATLRSVIEGISKRQPDATIICISPVPDFPSSDKVSDYLPIDPFPVSRYFWRLPESAFKVAIVNLCRYLTEGVRRRRAAKSIEGVTRLVIAGTGVIEDFKQGPLDLPMSVLRWTIAARQVGAAVSQLSVGAGPVVSPQSRRILRRASSLAEYRSYRDKYSRDYMQTLEFDASSDAIVSDLAFALDRPPITGPTNWPPKKIGVGVMGYSGWQSSVESEEHIRSVYLERSLALVKGLLDNGYEVSLLIGDVPGDQPVVDEIVARLGGGDKLKAPRLTGVDDLMRELQEIDVVVAARYHNQLLALLSGLPVIGLNYSPKGDALLASAGFSALSQNIEQMDVDKVIDDIRTLGAEGSGHFDTLEQFVTASRRDLTAQFDRVFSSSSD